MLNERMARDREKEKQLMERFNALLDEGRYDDALDVAAIVEEVDPERRHAPRRHGLVATSSATITSCKWLAPRAGRISSTRSIRWNCRRFRFPDDPPIVYPGCAVVERNVGAPQGPLRLDGPEGHGRSRAAHRTGPAIAAQGSRSGVHRSTARGSRRPVAGRVRHPDQARHGGARRPGRAARPADHRQSCTAFPCVRPCG